MHKLQFVYTSTLFTALYSRFNHRISCACGMHSVSRCVGRIEGTHCGSSFLEVLLPRFVTIAVGSFALSAVFFISHKIGNHKSANYAGEFA